MQTLSLLPLRIRQARRRAAALALITTGTLAVATAQAADEAAKEDAAKAEESSDSAEPKTNWIELGGGSSFVEGSKATFRERTGLSNGAFGGLSGLHYETTVATNTVLKIDGRGIFETGDFDQDYSLRLHVAKEGVGYVRGGVSGFRTYYDGTGGYLPSTGAWHGNLFDESMAVDRREYWIEGGLRLPKWPEFTIRYSHQERDGDKGSTSWGPTTVPGDTRRITPSFYALDERRDSIAVDARKLVGKVDVNLGVRYDHQEIDDTRNLRLYPGEGVVNDRYGTQREGSTSDLFNFHGSAETRLNDKLRFTVGYAYTDLDTDVTGYRVFGTGYDPDLANRLPTTGTFQNLAGDGTMSQHVANVNAFYTIAKDLDLIPSLRVEKQDRDARSLYQTPATGIPTIDYASSSDRGLLDVSEALELRYSGLTNIVLYARGEWLQGSGNLDETMDGVTTGSSIISRSTDDERSWQKYSFGAHWYPLRRISFSAGYYHKIRENDFDHSADNSPNLPPSINRYPAYLVAQSYTVDDANVRATWRPRNNVTVVGRYDFQTGTLENQADGLGKVDSAELTTHALSGSLSWVPVQRLYLQGRLSYVLDSTETPASGITASVQDAGNDYWTAELTAGYAVSNDVDLEGTYFYYRADNYSDNSLAGVPYLAGMEDQGVTATATWRLNSRTRWMARYAFVTSHDQATGGNTDFDAHTVYTSVQYRF